MQVVVNDPTKKTVELGSLEKGEVFKAPSSGNFYLVIGKNKGLPTSTVLRLTATSDDLLLRTMSLVDTHPVYRCTATLTIDVN